MSQLYEDIQRRLPWRRKYHDVSISHLLHSGKDLKQSEDSLQDLTLVSPQQKPSEVIDNPVKSDGSTHGHGKGERFKTQGSNKTRKKIRRHTVATASSININDIEKWISESKKTGAFEEPDCCFFAETRIVRTKLAENKTSMNWRVYGSERTTNEKRRSSCSDLSHYNDECAADHIKDYPERSDNCGVSSPESLKLKINRSLSCFLTPKPYGKSWDVRPLMASIMENHTLEKGEYDVANVECNSPKEKTNGREFIASNQDWKSDGEMACNSCGSATDTHSELSQSTYCLEEIQVSSKHTSGTVTSLQELDKLKEVHKNGHDNIREVVASVTSFLLDNIESSTVAECTNNGSATQAPILNGSCSIITEALKLKAESRAQTDSEKAIQSCSTDCTSEMGNSGLTNATEVEEVEAGKESTNSSDAVTLSLETFSVFGSSLSPTMTYESGGDDRINVNGAKDNTGVELTPVATQPYGHELDTTSTESNLGDDISSDVNFELNSSFPDDKTMSLDRNTFSIAQLNLMQSKLTTNQESRYNKEETKMSTENAQSTSEENSVTMRSGLKRLYQIAVSTVDAQRRPGAKIKDVMDLIESKGIRLSDPRMRETFRRIDAEANGPESDLSLEAFSRICSPSFHFIRGVLLSQLTIPGMSIFKLRMGRIFEKIRKILQQQTNQSTGSIDPFSNYNVMMRKRKSTHTMSLALCTVDGQRLSFGDKETPHPLNACATIFNYTLAHVQNGPEVMSHYFGSEAKPEDKGELTFNSGGKVWNPFTKAGSFVTSCLLFREMAVENRLDALHEFYDSLIGHEPLCCDNLSYNFKRSYAHEEICAAYNLSATQRLPRGNAELIAESLDFHFQSSSSAMTSDACAVAAATLANNGTCPLTAQNVLPHSSVRATLELLRISQPNLHAHAGERLQGVAGGWSENGSIMLVIPGVIGISCFTHCQSITKINQVVQCLFEELSANFNFGIYRSLKDRGNLLFQR